MLIIMYLFMLRALFLLMLIPLTRFSNPWEAAFVGALTAITFEIIASIAAKIQNKKNRVKEEKEQEKNRIDRDNSLKQEIAESCDDAVLITNNDYQGLYELLKQKCNPAVYMDPYDPDKVGRANDIYSQLEGNKNNIPALIELRNQAYRDLGISIPTEQVYSKLITAYSPNNFLNDKYNAERLKIANDVYRQVLNNKEDIIALEEIAKQCGLYKVGSFQQEYNEGDYEFYTEQESDTDYLDNEILSNVEGSKMDALSDYKCESESDKGTPQERADNSDLVIILIVVMVLVIIALSTL